jgi:hypothetical protein
MEFNIDIMDWLDLAWVVIALLAVHKGQKIKAVMFVLSCVLTLRLQLELMEEIGYPKGLLPFMDYPLMERGFITYSFFIALFIILSHYSRESDGYVYMAAAITVFMIAFCVSSFILIL